MKWKLRTFERKHSTDYWVDDADGMPIAHVDTLEAARLMVAAPTLLQELKAAIAWIENATTTDEYAPSADELLPQLRAAIAESEAK